MSSGLSHTATEPNHKVSFKEVEARIATAVSQLEVHLTETRSLDEKLAVVERQQQKQQAALAQSAQVSQALSKQVAQAQTALAHLAQVQAPGGDAYRQRIMVLEQQNQFLNQKIMQLEALVARRQ